MDLVSIPPYRYLGFLGSELNASGPNTPKALLSRSPEAKAGHPKPNCTRVHVTVEYVLWGPVYLIRNPPFRYSEPLGNPKHTLTQ